MAEVVGVEPLVAGVVGAVVRPGAVSALGLELELLALLALAHYQRNRAENACYRRPVASHLEDNRTPVLARHTLQAKGLID